MCLWGLSKHKATSAKMIANAFGNQNNAFVLILNKSIAMSHWQS